MKTSSQPVPNYLFLNGFGTYYFRIAIPRKLRDSIKKYEIRRTLKTKSYSVAVKKARRLAVMAETLFKKENMTEKELNELLLISTQIKMTGPVRIGNGVLECGSIETDPEKPAEEIQALSEIMKLVKSTAGSVEKANLVNDLLKRLLESNPTSAEIMDALQKLAGNTEQNHVVLPSPSGGKTSPAQAAGMLLDELIEKYCTQQKQNGSWSDKTSKENEAIFELLKNFFGDTPVHEISHDDTDRFRGVLMKLPPNMNRNPLYRGKSVSQVYNMKPVETLSTSSVNKYMRRISALFHWAEGREHVRKNTFEKKKIKDDKKPNEKRDMLTGQDLAAIFSPNSFYSELNKQYKFWLPIVGLYSGARLNEIAQLKAADIVEEEGIDCFRFVTSKQKEYTERLTPIHPHLKALGLLEYAKKQKDQLFPELKKGRDGYGKEVSRWYNIYRRKCGMTDLRNKDFHSLRHTCATTLKRAGVDSDLISEILGHSHQQPKSTTTQRVYIKPDELLALSSAIDKLDYGTPVNNLQPFNLLFPSAP